MDMDDVFLDYAGTEYLPAVLEEPDPVYERAVLIADIVAYAYGEDIAEILDGMLFKSGRQYLRHEKGSKYGGRFKARHTADSLAAIHENIGEALRGLRTADSADRLIQMLEPLTVKQLMSLKADYGIAASGRKADLVRKIADRLDRGRRIPPEPEPEPEPQPQPAGGMWAPEDPTGRYSVEQIERRELLRRAAKALQAGVIDQDKFAELVRRHEGKAAPEDWDKPVQPETQPQAARRERTASNDRETSGRRTNMVQAPAGGAISEVDGQFYAGGQWMPIHGLSVQPDEPLRRPTGTGDAPVANPEGRGRQRQPRGPMSPEQIEEMRERQREQREWDEVRRGPIADAMTMGDRPGYILSINTKRQVVPFFAALPQDVTMQLGDYMRQMHIDHEMETINFPASMGRDEALDVISSDFDDQAGRDADLFIPKRVARENPHIARAAWGLKELTQQNLGRDLITQNLKRVNQKLSELTSPLAMKSVAAFDRLFIKAQDCGTGAGGFKPGNTCAGDGKKKVASDGAAYVGGNDFLSDEVQEIIATGQRSKRYPKQFQKFFEVDWSADTDDMTDEQLDERFDLLEEFQNEFVKFLGDDAPGFSVQSADEQEGRRDVLRKTFQNMGPRLTKKVLREIGEVWHFDDCHHLTRASLEYAGYAPKDVELKMQSRIRAAGCYVYPEGRIQKGTLFLGSGSDLPNEQLRTSGMRANKTAANVYPHELGHVIGMQQRFSETRQWRSIWERELGGGKLTDYATTSAEEGFAEAFRFYVNERETLKQDFPDTYRFISQSFDRDD